MLNVFKRKWAGLFLISIYVLSCSTEDNHQGKVKLSSPTVEPGGSLSINASARFNAEVMDVADSFNLIYEWSLGEGRGALVVDDQVKEGQMQTTMPFVVVRGVTAGEETITVKVLDKHTGNSLGEDSITFEITEPSGISKCFDEPLLFFRNNNWDSPAVTAIGLGTDTRKTNNPSSQNWITDISKNGNWFLREDYSDSGNNFSIWMDACDGSESKKLAEGLHIYSPTFGPNDQYVYFSQYVSYPAQPEDPRSYEIARVNIETAEKVFISSFGVFSEEPKISPDGKWIAFKHGKETFNANGTYAGSIDHLAIIPSEGGPAQFLVQIEGNDLAGFDWSPDSKDIIFNWHKQSGSSATHTNGIYRVYIDGGGSPSLIFPEPQGNGSPIYYANGARIAFHGHPSGSTDTQYDIWSIDANGGDLQRITDEKYNVFLQFIWEP
ncbi:hypothetical protein [Confluentibacter sediminis]|uniref:hypothetical protein n=1 Tax=Confluentibacter sediminis TaxID=2219045 RepID=UPI0013A6BE67|nr:hypothetical protein [Confluentibacter sediminis]